MSWVYIVVGVVVLAVVMPIIATKLIRTFIGDNDVNDSDRDGKTNEWD